MVEKNGNKGKKVSAKLLRLSLNRFWRAESEKSNSSMRECPEYTFKKLYNCTRQLSDDGKFISKQVKVKIRMIIVDLNPSS